MKTTLILLLTFCVLTNGSASDIAGTERGRQPQLTCDERGDVHIAYGCGDEIFYLKSSDGGKLFTAPVVVAKVSHLMLGMRRGPRIAVINNAILVTAPSDDLLSFVSTDGGTSWSKANRVNDKERAAREGLHNIVAIPKAGFFATWLDGRNGKTEIWGANSADGLHWNNNRLIYHSPNGSVCECCHPSVAVSQNGDMTVMWRNSIEGSRDMYFTKSRDHGTTFSKAAKLGTGTWKLNACPMDGGSLALYDDGRLLSVWRRDGSLFSSSSERDETQLANGAQPAVTISRGVPIMAWSSNNTIYLKTDAKSPAAIGKGNYPCLSSHPKSGAAFVVWESDAEPATLQVLRIDPNGRKLE